MKSLVHVTDFVGSVCMAQSIGNLIIYLSNSCFHPQVDQRQLNGKNEHIFTMCIHEQPSSITTDESGWQTDSCGAPSINNHIMVEAPSVRMVKVSDC